MKTQFSKKQTIAACLLLIAFPFVAHAAEVTNLNTFTSSTPAKAADVNSNFEALKNANNDNNTRIQNLESNSSAQANRLSTVEEKTKNANVITGDLAQAISGFVTVGSGSTTVNGTDTKFSSELRVGNAIKIANESFTVAAIASDTSLTLSKAHSAGALNAQAFVDHDLLNVRDGNQSTALSVNRSGETVMFRRIAHSSGVGDDTTQSGQIVSRVLTINKLRDDTTIRIGYTDNFRVIGGSVGAACTWEIRIDQKTCPSGGLNYSIHSSSSSSTINEHIPQQVVGYCDGLSVGAHQIGIYVSPTIASVPSDCYTGWHTTWSLEAEEVY